MTPKNDQPTELQKAGVGPSSSGPSTVISGPPLLSIT